MRKKKSEKVWLIMARSAPPQGRWFPDQVSMKLVDHEPTTEEMDMVRRGIDPEACENFVSLGIILLDINGKMWHNIPF
jgi:hypothetical protein